MSTTPPPHLLGALFKAHTKATYAISRAHHARRHRCKFYRHIATNSKVAVGKNKWTTAHDKWQKRFAEANKRLEPYNIWVTKQELDP